MRERLVLAGVVAAAVVLATARPVLGQLDQLRRALGLATPPAGLTDARVAAALREALQVSTRNAVQLTGRLDGYFANEAIRIPMPDRLRSLERGLRALGYGAKQAPLVQNNYVAIVPPKAASPAEWLKAKGLSQDPIVEAHDLVAVPVNGAK